MKTGDRFDRYVLAAELGDSGELPVRTWSGRDTLLDRLVLVRFIPSSERRAALAIDAAREAARVDTQYLARIYDVVLVPATKDEPEMVAIVTEWLDGTSLVEALQAGPLMSIEQATTLATTLSEGLAVAHRAGVQHGRVRVAAIVDVAEVGYELRGLAVDAAIFGPLRDDLPSVLQDIDGLGRVLYQALTGQVPPLAESPVPPSWVRADVPGWLDDIVMGSIAIAGERQPLTSLAQVRDRIPGRVSTRRRRHLPGLAMPDIARRLVSTALALAVVTTLAFLGFIIVQGDPPEGSASSDARGARADRDLLVTPVERPSESPTTTAPMTVRAVTARSFTPTFTATSATEGPDLAEAFGDDELTTVNDSANETCWTSRAYRSPVVRRGGGVGLVVDLGRSADVDAVAMTFESQGSDVDVRVGDSTLVDPRSWPLLTQAAQGDSVITLRGTEPRRGRFVLLWFPRLPATIEPPDRYQVSVCEIRVNAS